MGDKMDFSIVEDKELSFYGHLRQATTNEIFNVTWAAITNGVSLVSSFFLCAFSKTL